MKNVIFYIDKTTNKFRSYQIIEKSIDELKIAVNNFNLIGNRNDVAIVVEDQHVIDAMIQRESRETINGFLEDIKEAQKEVENSNEHFYNTIERTLDNLIDMFKIEQPEGK